MFYNRTSLIVVTVKVLFIILICFEQLIICSSISSPASSSLPFKVINNTVRIINSNKNGGIQNLIPASVKDYICTREENYTEIVQIPTQQTVRVRTSNWCLEIPPRCSNYRTEIREIIKIENVTKTRTIRFCCEGYAGILSGNETICRPICRGGCGRGYCYAPDECKCENGYIGRHCTQRCPSDQWGAGCQMKCQCRNNAICDHKNGACRCQSGWIGDKCHIPCPSGFYGSMCKTLCQCEPQECNPQTGQCIFEKSTTKLTIVKELIPFEKITADEMLKSLNSTNSNKTENFGKNLITPDPVALIIPTIELTTIQPIAQTILFITPENPTILIDDTPLLETDFDTSIEISKSPEVIHIIDWNQQQLTAAISSNTTNNLNTDSQSRDLSALIMSMIIFSLIFSIILIGFLIFYRQYFFKRETNVELPGNSNISGSVGDSGLQKQINSKIFIKPLPDLPAFTQNLKKTDNVPEFYDCPSNNSAVCGRNLYSYATGSIYTQVPKQYIKKESLDSHLYDEIRYPPKAKSCRV